MSEANKIEKHKGGDAQSHRKRILQVGVALSFLVAVLHLIGAFDIMELKTQDWRFLARGNRVPRLKAAVVAIDDESLNGWTDAKGDSKYMDGKWTWPRSFYARVIDNLKEAGAAYIAFDITFSESDKLDPRQDKALAEAAKRAGNVVFAEMYTKLANGAQKTQTLVSSYEKAMLDKGHVHPEFGIDGFLRAYRPLYYNSDGRLDREKPGIDIAILRQMTLGKPEKPVFDAERGLVSVGDFKIPVNGFGNTLINYCGPAGSFPTIPFHDVYYKTADMSVFKGRVVYIGSTCEILHDNHPTPFSPVTRMPGVETHAHYLDTLLTREFLSESPWWLNYLLILGLGILVSTFTFRVKPLLGAAVMTLMLSIYAVVVFFCFIQFRLILPLVSPLVSIAVSSLGISVYRGFIEERKARSTRAMFSRYVSKHIVDEIMKNPDAVKLGGEVKEVSILFSDVRGFTAMSERLSAPEVVEVLNEYLTKMVDVVIANNGTLDKYVGDAIMAVWGSPVADPKHEENAARTAVMMMEVLHELQAKWVAEGKVPLDIGIGINSGHVVAGNMGHPEYKMDYTVIGDDVNLAARLESANKEMKAHVLISGTTYEKTKHLVEVVKHPDIHVKGKEKAVEVYEVIGWKGQGRAVWAVPLKG